MAPTFLIFDDTHTHIYTVPFNFVWKMRLREDSFIIHKFTSRDMRHRFFFFCYFSYIYTYTCISIKFWTHAHTQTHNTREHKKYKQMMGWVEQKCVCVCVLTQRVLFFFRNSSFDVVRAGSCVKKATNI